LFAVVRIAVDHLAVGRLPLERLADGGGAVGRRLHRDAARFRIGERNAIDGDFFWRRTLSRALLISFPRCHAPPGTGLTDAANATTNGTPTKLTLRQMPTSITSATTPSSQPTFKRSSTCGRV